MKVAILGPSQKALDLTLALHEMGASVRLFWGPTAHGLNPELAQAVVVPHPWLRVTKRFLQVGDTPAGRSRFHDLFRVVYQVDPTPLVQASKEFQPQMFEKMSEDFLTSLKGQLEMFEDVDVVVDATLGVPLNYLGPGGPAVGEPRMRPETLLHWPSSTNLSQWVEGTRELAVVGSGPEAQEVLQQLWPWLEKGQHRVFLVTPEERPFAHPTPGFKPLWEGMQSAHEGHLKRHAVALAEWEELDDFVKAKKPRPDEPVPPLIVFSGHMVSAVDQLVDQTRSFVTCEKIPWAEGHVQPENNALELKTLGVDKIIGAMGLKRPVDQFYGLDLRRETTDGTHPEIGFFTLAGAVDTSHILNALMKLFSPREGEA